MIAVLASWRPLFDGTLVTIGLMIVIGVVAPLIALPLALLRDSRFAVGAAAVAVFSWLMRASPTLVLLFFIYYGLPEFGIYLPPIPAALIAMILSSAGYNVEFFRAGFRAVPKGQFDAARALGIPWHRAFVRIIMPQALTVTVPPLFSNLTLNLKGTALASLVSVSELTAQTSGLIAETYKPLQFLLAAGAIYLVLNSALIALQARIERALSFDQRSRKALSSKPPGMSESAAKAASL